MSKEEDLRYEGVVILIDLPRSALFQPDRPFPLHVNPFTGFKASRLLSDTFRHGQSDRHPFLHGGILAAVP